MFSHPYNVVPLPIPPRPGAYIDCALSNTALGMAGAGADIARYYPLIADSDMLVDQFAIEVMSGFGFIAAPMFSFGAYKSDGANSYYPGTAIEIQNNVPITGLGFCEKAFTAPVALAKGELIWVALHCNAPDIVTRSIPANTGSQPIIGRIKSPIFNGYATGLSESRPFAGGLPQQAIAGAAQAANMSGNRLMLRQA